MAERRKKPEETKVEEVVSIETGNTEEKPEEKPEEKTGEPGFDAEGWITKILDTLNNHEDRLKDVEQVIAAAPQQQPSPQEQEGAVTFFEQVEFPTYGDQTPAEPTQDIPDYQPSYLR